MVLSPATPAPPGDKCPRTPDGSLAEAAAQCCVRVVGHGGIVIADCGKLDQLDIHTAPCAAGFQVLRGGFRSRNVFGVVINTGGFCIHACASWGCSRDFYT